MTQMLRRAARIPGNLSKTQVTNRILIAHIRTHPPNFKVPLPSVRTLKNPSRPCVIKSKSSLGPKHQSRVYKRIQIERLNASECTQSVRVSELVGLRLLLCVCMLCWRTAKKSRAVHPRMHSVCRRPHLPVGRGALQPFRCSWPAADDLTGVCGHASHALVAWRRHGGGGCCCWRRRRSAPPH